MLENSWASNSRLFIGVLSIFPKLRTSIFRIAGQPFIRWIRVIRSLNNLCLNCNRHCIRIISRIFELPPIRREQQLWTACLQACKLKSPDISSYIVRYEKCFICRIKWILWCFGSWRLFRIVEILFGGFAVDGRHLESKHKETRLSWASDVKLLNCSITQEHVFSNGGHILRNFGAKKY